MNDDIDIEKVKERKSIANKKYYAKNKKRLKLKRLKIKKELQREERRKARKIREKERLRKLYLTKKSNKDA